MKSERLRKLEQELHELKVCVDLGLIPKKDVAKYELEIESLKKRVDEEKQRLQTIKESDEEEEFSLPKRNQARQVYQEPQTLPGVDLDEGTGLTDGGFESEMPTTFETESGTMVDEEEGATTIAEEEEEDPFSDKNRWRRGILEDPDADAW